MENVSKYLLGTLIQALNITDDNKLAFAVALVEKIKEVESTGKHFCGICGAEYEEYPNNAWPVYDGTCCNACDYKFVIPARICNIKDENEFLDFVFGNA